MNTNQECKIISLEITEKLKFSIGDKIYYLEKKDCDNFFAGGVLTFEEMKLLKKLSHGIRTNLVAKFVLNGSITDVVSDEQCPLI